MHNLLVLMIIPLILSLPYWQQQYKICRWKRLLQINAHLSMMAHLYQDVDGFAASKRARIKQDAMEYVYGEIELLSFMALLSLIKPDHNTVFYDLGCGSGKAVFACALVYDVKKSCGIELFAELYELAIQQKDRLMLLVSDDNNKIYAKKASTVCFINDNFLQADFNDATLIFINATGFFGATWEALNLLLSSIKSCQIVITTSKKLTIPVFKVMKITIMEMSWGLVKVYIHQRVSI